MAYKPSSDKVLFFTAGFLIFFGLLMVYNASSVVASSRHEMSSYLFLKQSLFASVGFALLIVLMKTDYHRWRKPAVYAAALALSALALLYVLEEPAVNGARRWIFLGGLSFQPSEPAKLAVIVFIAAYLDRYESEINQPGRRLLPLVLVTGFFAAAIAMEPDLGQALCICFIAAVLLFVAGLYWKYFAYAIGSAIPLFYIFVVRVPYRWERIMVWLDPARDPEGSGWQISQSLIAMGSGGLTGLGLGAGKHKLFYVPEPSSDFIYAVIGEELGLLGTIAVICAFLVFFFRGMRIVLGSSDRFGFYLALGITLMVVLPAFINISMVLGLLPTKGIALPFISQGGTSLLLNLLATGILLNLSHRNQLAARDPLMRGD
ncbi:MAG: putative lipid II flippase FtsW [Acidobacteria bacterium]|nr:putative lipid II flippase FtsW [Acidobacteriota bacterium]